MKINNLPAYAINYSYIVSFRENGEFWFWGAYNNRNRANEAALDINGVTWEINMVDIGD